VDWNERGEEYQERLFELFNRSDNKEISQTEIDELEHLLRVD